jgi:hypothetical protein
MAARLPFSWVAAHALMSIAESKSVVKQCLTKDLLPPSDA